MRSRHLGNFSNQSIERLRSKFLKEYHVEESLFDEEDVKRIREDSWFIIRFLFIQHNDEEAALKNLVDAMKWRKAKDWRNFKANFFPEEFFRVGGMFMYEPDLDGGPTIYIRIKFLKRIPLLQSTIEDFGSYQMFNADEESSGNGWTLIMDFQEAGIQNADFESVKYLITTLKTYFPGGVHHLLCFEMPWILKACWNVVRGWVPSNRRDLVKFATRKDVTDYIARENLPDFMGGTCQRPYKGWPMVPEGCPTGTDFGVKIMGAASDDVKKLFDIYKTFLDDC